jgi:hypothetical protein
MKNLVLSLTMAIVTATSVLAAPSTVIEKKMRILGNIAYGYSVERVKGETARDLMRAFAVKQGLDGEEFDESYLPRVKANDVTINDRLSWGHLSLSQAQEIFSQTEAKVDEDGNELDEKKAASNARVAEAVINELAELGMEFGVSTHASGYCGVSFGGLLVIDVEKGKIYEISLTPSGSC